MKSSYELAMERLNKTAPSTKVSPKLKQELAELDSQYAAKIAEREIALASEIARATRTNAKNSSSNWRTRRNGCGRGASRPAFVKGASGTIRGWF